MSKHDTSGHRAVSPALSRRWLVGAGAGLTLHAWAQPAEALDVGRFAAGGAGAGVLEHAAFDAVLARHARRAPDGVVRVDYAGWRRSTPDRRALDDYVAALSRAAPLALTRPEQFAFWANLYNALTLQIVLAAFPVASIRNIGGSILPTGPWKKAVIRVQGVSLSLDDIEHGILRKGWRDPRVHYAVNCASVSCPNLPLRAWRGHGLDTALDAAARDYVNHPRAVRFEAEALVVSSIYRWYAPVFGGGDAAVIRHLARYARPELAERLRFARRISRTAYDWSLNAMSDGSGAA
jgi:Protein of unknown function, DUF547